MISIKKILVVSGLVFSMSNVFAMTLVKPCPTVEELAAFDGDLVVSLPMNYEIASNTFNFSLIQAKYNSPNDTTAFILSGINAGKDQDSEVLANELIGQLKPETEYPIKYELSDNQYLPLCSYSVPGNSAVKGLVFTVSHNVKHGWIVNTIQHLIK